MRIFTRMRNWPELRCFSDSERKRLIRQSSKERLRHWEWWVASGALFLSIIPYLLAMLSGAFGLPRMSQGAHLFCLVVGGATFLSSNFVVAMLSVHFLRCYLHRAILKQYDGKPPSCFACGYNLRYCENFDRSGCPECGWLPTSATEGTMDRETRTMRFLTGSPIRLTFLIVLALFIGLLLYGALRYAGFGVGRRDVRFIVRDIDRSMVGHRTTMALGNSGFEAHVALSMYSDKNNEEWDYYAIEVLKPVGTTYQIFFACDFRMDQIPAQLVDKNANDIVTFDEETGLVTFTLGSETYTWTLPRR